jgi:hypothetical protein
MAGDIETAVADNIAAKKIARFLEKEFMMTAQLE